MLPMLALRILLVAPILLVAAVFLALSGAILLRRRPIVLRGSLFTWVLFIVWAPVAVATLVVAFYTSEAEPTCLAVLQMGILLLFAVAARRFMRGYMIIGISADSLRDSVRSSLTRLGLPFEETVMGFALPLPHEMLETRIEPRLGTAQLQMNSSGRPEILKQIAQRVDEHLRLTGEGPSPVAPVIFGVAELIALALAIYQAQRL